MCACCGCEEARVASAKSTPRAADCRPWGPRKAQHSRRPAHPPLRRPRSQDMRRCRRPRLGAALRFAEVRAARVRAGDRRVAVASSYGVQSIARRSMPPSALSPQRTRKSKCRREPGAAMSATLASSAATAGCRHAGSGFVGAGWVGAGGLDPSVTPKRACCPASHRHMLPRPAIRAATLARPRSQASRPAASRPAGQLID